MTFWKRWFVPRRIGALFSLGVLVLCAGCAIPIDLVPRYTVPGISGTVYAEVLYDTNGRPYFGIKNSDDSNSIRFVYPGDPQFDLIINFFRGHPNISVFNFALAGTPGVSGLLPPPAVQ